MNTRLASQLVQSPVPLVTLPYRVVGKRISTQQIVDIVPGVVELDADGIADETAEDGAAEDAGTKLDAGGITLDPGGG